MRITTLRLVTIALLILLALAVFFSFRTLWRLPNVVVYFLKSEETSFTLAPAYRREAVYDKTVAGLEQQLEIAMQRLLEGPTSAEQQRGLSSAIPAETKLLDLRLENDLVTVNLSQEFETGGGMASMRGRLEQVFYTLTQPSDVERVSLLIDGNPITVFGGEGIMLDNPWTRATRDTLPIW